MKTVTPNLMADDVNLTADYYVKHFGFKVVTTVPDMKNPGSGNRQFAILVNGGANLMIQSRDTLAEDIPEMKTPKTGGTFTLYFDVENVTDLFEQVKNHVTYTQGGLYNTFYGTKEFTICDLNGYYLTFAQGILYEL